MSLTKSELALLQSIADDVAALKAAVAALLALTSQLAVTLSDVQATAQNAEIEVSRTLP